MAPAVGYALLLASQLHRTGPDVVDRDQHHHHERSSGHLVFFFRRQRCGNFDYFLIISPLLSIAAGALAACCVAAEKTKKRVGQSVKDRNGDGSLSLAEKNSKEKIEKLRGAAEKS